MSAVQKYTGHWILLPCGGSKLGTHLLLMAPMLCYLINEKTKLLGNVQNLSKADNISVKFRGYCF